MKACGRAGDPGGLQAGRQYGGGGIIRETGVLL